MHTVHRAAAGRRLLLAPLSSSLLCSSTIPCCRLSATSACSTWNGVENMLSPFLFIFHVLEPLAKCLKEFCTLTSRFCRRRRLLFSHCATAFYLHFNFAWNDLTFQSREQRSCLGPWSLTSSFERYSVMSTMKATSHSRFAIAGSHSRFLPLSP